MEQANFGDYFEDLLDDVLGIVFRAEDIFSGDSPNQIDVEKLTHIMTSDAAELPNEVAVNPNYMIEAAGENWPDGDLNYLLVAGKAMSHLAFNLGEIDWPVDYLEEMRAVRSRLEAMAHKALELGELKKRAEDLDDLLLEIINP